MENMESVKAQIPVQYLDEQKWSFKSNVPLMKIPDLQVWFDISFKFQ